MHRFEKINISFKCLTGIGLPVAYVDVEHLPEPMPQGHFKPVPPGDKATFIDFDLETTDLGN